MKNEADFKYIGTSNKQYFSNNYNPNVPLLHSDVIELYRLLMKFNDNIAASFLTALFYQKVILPPQLFAQSFSHYKTPLMGYNNNEIVSSDEWEYLANSLKEYNSYAKEDVGKELLNIVANSSYTTRFLSALHHLKHLSNIVNEPNFNKLKSNLSDYALKAWPYNHVEIFENEYNALVFNSFAKEFSITTEQNNLFTSVQEYPYKWLINENYLVWGHAFANVLIQEFNDAEIALDYQQAKQLMAYINTNSVYTADFYISNFIKYLPVDPQIHYQAKKITDNGKPEFLKTETDFNYVTGRILNFLYYFNECGQKVTLKQIEVAIKRIQIAWNK